MYLFNICSVFLGCYYSTECTKNSWFAGFILVKITIKLMVCPELWPENTNIHVYFRGIIWYNIDSWKGYRSYQPGPLCGSSYRITPGTTGTRGRNKKAFPSVTSTRKGPGLPCYQHGSALSLKCFPRQLKRTLLLYSRLSLIVKT